MVRAAEEFAVADKKKKEFIEAKNDGDSLVYSTEKSLSEHKAKLSAEDITAIEAALADTRKALGTEDVDALKASTQALQTAAMRIGTAMYKGAGGASSSSGAAEGEPKAGGGGGADGGETKESSFKDKSN
jgi:molecular chaperone DnaK